MVMGECISASKCWSLLRGGQTSHRRGLSIEGLLYIQIYFRQSALGSGPVCCSQCLHV